MSDQPTAQLRKPQFAHQPVLSTSVPVKDSHGSRERLLRWLAVLVARALHRARNGDNG